MEVDSEVSDAIRCVRVSDVSLCFDRGCVGVSALRTVRVGRVREGCRDRILVFHDMIPVLEWSRRIVELFRDSARRFFVDTSIVAAGIVDFEMIHESAESNCSFHIIILFNIPYKSSPGNWTGGEEEWEEPECVNECDAVVDKDEEAEARE